MTAPKAVVLVSGGLDSATALAIAREQEFICHTLSFDYGQRHRVELQAAAEISRQMGAVEHKRITIDLGGFGGSALTDPSMAVPEASSGAIPITYVPARNTVFLSFALGWAEVLGAQDIFIGVNAVDYSGYPDCRPAFIKAFEHLAKLATCAGLEGRAFRIQAPLLHLSKAEIIREGMRLGIDYSRTISCYQADENGQACGVCDSCRFRKQGFWDAGVPDPTRYH
ncbi:7-cyano-7-deazaguanine synthase QueC [Nitrosococcus oceani]|uniref:7-cyano-7-deazaguanine synthase QueC n=1 Tax=Nitrosococcus oceani TaxID=1229 RepID=UPI0004E8F010|nr:7-cyano-7-deazaguanine synthase QueC [Nitrosococcus oceani]KFI24011.1 7-cyano-7-deazaguanine synthase [Nitrosococcus oceani]